MIFDQPASTCTTFDNIFVSIDVSVVFKCIEDDDAIQRFVYNISINQLNEQLEAAILERLRVLGKYEYFLILSFSKRKDPS